MSIKSISTPATAAKGIRICITKTGVQGKKQGLNTEDKRLSDNAKWLHGIVVSGEHRSINALRRKPSPTIGDNLTTEWMCEAGPTK